MEKQDQPKIMSDLVMMASRFATIHPNINDPTLILATGQHYYNELFCIEANHPDMTVRPLHLQGQVSSLKNRHPAFFKQSNPSLEFYHCVCMINDKYIVDVTNKIVDTKGQAVYMSTITDVNKNWHAIGSSYAVLETYNNIDLFLKQTSLKWHAVNFPDWTMDVAAKSVSENFKLAKLYYNKTIDNMLLGNLVFTQISGCENPLLNKLNNEWKPLLEDVSL